MRDLNTLRSAVLASALVSSAFAEDPTPTETLGGDFRSRPKLTGDWAGVRDDWAARGLSLDLDSTYIFQNVVEGGRQGRLFDRFLDDGDSANTVSTDLKLEFDAEKAGLWDGGFLSLRLEDRSCHSLLQRTGSVSAVNNDALFPNVVDDFDEEAFAVTDLSYTQYFGEKFAVFGGLLNNAEGDANELAGSALSNEHFLNSALLYSLVEDTTVPNTSLGIGVLLEPTENISGSFSVFGTKETAGEDPFGDWHGTTFSTEWTFGHTLFDRLGAQTVGLLYGIDASRTDIAADPRAVIRRLDLGRPLATTESDTWAFYYNAHQYIQGGPEGGWGVFARLGISDGNPNPLGWNMAGGVGGTGLIPTRDADRWGLGAFYLDMSDEDLVSALGLSRELGGELFYNIEVTSWLHISLDAQVIDSALPAADTAWVLGLRTHVSF